MRTHGPSTITHRSLALAAALAVALAACGGDDGADDALAGDATTTEAPTDDGTAMDDMADDDSHASEGMDDMDMSGDYGESADPSEADRVIEVSVDNEFAFDPNGFEVDAGEVVTFRISNTGDLEHEFVLGDEEAQNAMAEEMDAGDGHAHSGDMSNAVTIHPGETSELTWRFGSPGTVLIGCHVPGHYEAGMTGTVTVNG